MPFLTGFHIKTHPRIRPLKLSIDAGEREFRHVVITGRNGTGKTTLLDALWSVIKAYPNDQFSHLQRSHEQWKRKLKGAPRNADIKKQLAQVETALTNVNAVYFGTSQTEKEHFVRVYLRDERKLKHTEQPGKVPEPVAPSNRVDVSQSQQFVAYLKHQSLQKLLTRANGETDRAEAIEKWLNDLVGELSSIFEIDGLHLDFNSKTYELRFVEPDGTSYNFSQLSAGFSAVLDIVGELLMRLDGLDVDRAGRQVTGVALIDEIDTHLHPLMQENILPFLARMFPRIQLVVATHSPAVIGSIEGAVVFDLDRMEDCLSEEYQGMPYGQVLTGHFGLPTDVDAATTLLLEEAQSLIENEKRSDEEDKRLWELVQRLRKTGHPMILLEYSRRLIALSDESPEK